jgi:hypothetical protein
MAKIYISSTYSDLKEYREKVYRTLHQWGHQVIAMEDYVASDQRPLDRCLADVAGCDLYVGIFAWRYGYVPDRDNPAGLSVTELEYRQAGEAGLPRLVFLLDDDAPWPPTQSETVTDPEGGGRRILALRAELKKDKLVSFFKNADELANQVSRAVQKQVAGQAPVVAFDAQAVQALFVDHMRRFAGARSEEDALHRYLDLRLQATQAQEQAQKEGGTVELPAGRWDYLVGYPANILVTGEAGSGKSTLLLHEVYHLAAQAETAPDARLPLYLPLGSYAGGGDTALLELAGAANKLPREGLAALWQKKQRPICLFLDGVEDVPDRHFPALSAAILGLCQAGAGTHSVIVACRPGPFADSFSAEAARLACPFSHFILLPLNDGEIFTLLNRYEARELARLLDDRLREVVQSPDLLSGLAQSVHLVEEAEIPRNAGQIYRLLVDRYLMGDDAGSYDYALVKRPILATLAYRMLAGDQSALPRDESLYAAVAAELEKLDARYRRRRKAMPRGWSAEELLDELCATPLLARGGDSAQLRFAKRGYQDYFAATYLDLLGVRSPEMQALVPGLDPQAWIRPMILLLGLQPEAGGLFDALYAGDARFAVQLWIENRPSGVEAPGLIVAACRQQGDKLRTSPLGGITEPVTARLLTGLLAGPDPRRRLQALGAAAQWGVGAADFLLAAAEDEQPLIQATAWYALLHLGEPDTWNDAYRPLPPLLEVTDGGLRFSGRGGGRLQVGPLTLLQVPRPALLTLDVEIGRLDFDPFAADTETKFAPLATPPVLLAAALFEAKGQVDWVDLTLRYCLIADQAASLLPKLGQRPGLKKLAKQVRDRAASYASLGTLLADDLGYDWSPPGPLGLSGKDAGQAKKAYTWLRRWYSLANQARASAIAPAGLSWRPGQGGDSKIALEQNVKEVQGEVVAVRIDKIEPLGAGPGQTATYTAISFRQAIGQVDGGQVRGVVIDQLYGADDLLPLRLRIDGQVTVERATGGEIAFLQVRQHFGKNQPWSVTGHLRIGELAGSRLVGVAIEEMEGGKG